MGGSSSTCSEEKALSLLFNFFFKGYEFKEGNLVLLWVAEGKTPQAESWLSVSGEFCFRLEGEESHKKNS